MFYVFYEKHYVCSYKYSIVPIPFKQKYASLFQI